MNCTVYKCARQSDTYLFVASGTEPSSLPDALRELLGALDVVIEIELNAQRRLARASAPDVIASIEARGYYLQLPPTGALPDRLAS